MKHWELLLASGWELSCVNLTGAPAIHQLTSVATTLYRAGAIQRHHLISDRHHRRFIFEQTRRRMLTQQQKQRPNTLTFSRATVFLLAFETIGLIGYNQHVNKKRKQSSMLWFPFISGPSSLHGFRWPSRRIVSVSTSICSNSAFQFSLFLPLLLLPLFRKPTGTIFRPTETHVEFYNLH